jgi:hypothetical protein
MLCATSLRRQARVCAKLADESEDSHLADRLRTMACDLIAKADECQELQSERLRNTTIRKLLAA